MSVSCAVTESSGYWLTVLLAAAPLYLTYKMYCAGAASEAQQGAILQSAHDAIVTMDANLNIREFNPAAEQMSAIRAWLVRPLGGREQQLDGSAKPDEHQGSADLLLLHVPAEAAASDQVRRSSSYARVSVSDTGRASTKRRAPGCSNASLRPRSTAKKQGSGNRLRNRQAKPRIHHRGELPGPGGYIPHLFADRHNDEPTDAVV